MVFFSKLFLSSEFFYQTENLFDNRNMRNHFKFGVSNIKIESWGLQ
jgi:hypothetical protein